MTTTLKAPEISRRGVLAGLGGMTFCLTLGVDGVRLIGEAQASAMANAQITPWIRAVGTTEIDILFLGRAHTGGDLEVFLPRENILFMSEVFINRIFPSMANGYPTEWIAALKKAEDMHARIYVPAHGFIDSPDVLNEEMRNYRAALEKVRSEGKRLHDAGVTVERAVAQADFGPFANWTRVNDNAANGLKRVYMELDGELK